jgi:hypothetical protein
MLLELNKFSITFRRPKRKDLSCSSKSIIVKRVDCYIDADFGGLFSVDDQQQAISVKSRTGYVILYHGAPLLWVFKMQTQVALSTMEAKYIALSQSMQDLIPICDILHEILTSLVFDHVQPLITYHSHSVVSSRMSKKSAPLAFDVQPSITYHSHSRIFEDVQVGTARHVAEVDSSHETYWGPIASITSGGLGPKLRIFPFTLYVLIPMINLLINSLKVFQLNLFVLHVSASW